MDCATKKKPTHLRLVTEEVLETSSSVDIELTPIEKPQAQTKIARPLLSFLNSLADSLEKEVNWINSDAYTPPTKT